ncbi:TPM domain-containing protein [Nonomuraea typhae]|uniref:TPM domain-containing protein n=1 Tax=Nonomuraea typhae TaxID=2603600 RepID=UPI001CA4A949|nr:TPM domain-containing protein [Nonomuraea typhae]
MLSAFRHVTRILLITGAFLTMAGTAHAEAPDAVTQTVTDHAGALGSRAAEVRGALDQLERAHGIRLYVVYVRDFSGWNATTWADQTAAFSNLGRNDPLLAVATVERRYAVSAADGFPLSNAQMAQVAGQDIVPALQNGDWAGAAIGAAQGYGAAVAGTPDTGSGSAWWLAGAGVLALTGGGVYLYARRRRVSTAAKDLDTRAGQALVHTDDAVKTSEQEVGFAVAQFGEEAAQPFAEALAYARGELDQAFRLRQRLDDEVREDAETRRAMLEEIVRRCAAANARLDAESEAFDKLRDLEKQAPQILAEVRQAHAELVPKVAEVRRVMAATAERFADSALTPVHDNPDEAANRLEFAGQTLAKAQASLAAGESGRAVAQVLAAQSAVDQARRLLEAVTRRADDVRQAAAGLKPALEAVAANLSAAKALAADAAYTADLAPQIAYAESTATQVAQDVVAGGIDPIALLRRAEEAQATLDRAMKGVRDKKARQDQARGLLGQAMLTARSEIAATKDFITTNRGAVGSTARTRLAEAERMLAEAGARAGAEPAAALAAAQRADQLAQEAGRAARGEVSAFGPRGGRGGDALMGAVLGGILIDGMLGGVPRGGGAGQGPGRRARTPGSFGGQATRGRRGSGGAF